jgi:hypothetical protein
MAGLVLVITQADVFFSLLFGTDLNIASVAYDLFRGKIAIQTLVWRNALSVVVRTSLIPTFQWASRLIKVHLLREG